MAGQIISLFIGAVIVYLAARALIKSFRDSRKGKCVGCSGNCSICSIQSKDE